MDTLYGFVEHIVYQDETGEFFVARLKEPRKTDLTCIVGKMPGLRVGETLSAKGKWSFHPKHGQQFEVATFESKTPSDLMGIQKYLESGLIKGIGPAYAGRIVKAFGVETLNIIDQIPDRLLSVNGLGSKRVERIKACWQEQKSIREVIIFLRSYDISPAFAQKIFRTYGANSIEKVKENPYRLAKEIFGIGFKMADKVAFGLGISGNALIRVESGIEHTLWQISNEGHTCFPKEELLSTASLLLGVTKEDITTGLASLTNQGLIEESGGMVALKPLHLYELGIAKELARLKSSKSCIRSVDIEKALSWVQEILHIDLAPEQKEGVKKSLEEKVHILTGGPGTGKSTITKAILAISEKLTKSILLCAPTGRAAKRMTEITKRKSVTLHSLLEVDFTTRGFKKGPDNRLDCDLLLCDEVSMIDTKLMYSLLRALPDRARIVFIGDVDQLPSVGPGKVLSDLITSKTLPTTELKKIFRQAAYSQIIVNAHRINEGEFPFLNQKANSDFFFIEEEEPEKIQQTLIDLLKTRLPQKYGFNPFESIQLLCPMKRGPIGTDMLNHLLQEALNPNDRPLFQMGRRFHNGDKVMQIKNNYTKEVFNGDVGRIIEIDNEEQTLIVLFEDKEVIYEFSDLNELVLAYAVSIHKYQGSESPAIIIPVHTSHFKLLFRNLLYTGVTRGKKLVVLVGTKKAVAIAIRNKEALLRHTKLKEKLVEIMKNS